MTSDFSLPKHVFTRLERTNLVVNYIMESEKKAILIKEQLEIIDSIDKGEKRSFISRCLGLMKSTINIT